MPDRQDIAWTGCSMLMRNCFLCLLLLLLCSCVSRPAVIEPQTVHGVVIDTLQGGVNVSLQSPAGKMSGNGFLFYRRPETFRITILAPFGQSVLDIIVNNGKVLCLADSRKKGWQGEMADLPPWLGSGIWPLLKWVVEPPHPAGASLERSFSRSDGSVEKIFYNSAGFVQKKVNSSGDLVTYGDYRVIDGIAVPMLIEIATADGNRLKLVLDEPEVNKPVEDAVLAPDLKGYEILPLAEFKGF